MAWFGLFRKKEAPVQKSFQERRLIPRWPVKASVQVRGVDGGAIFECDLLDINMKGFAVCFKGKYPPELTTVTLVINGHHFSVEITPVWHQQRSGADCYGFKFTRLREADRERLYHMMREEFPHVFKP
jgi:hypothetical protein